MKLYELLFKKTTWLLNSVLLENVVDVVYKKYFDNDPVNKEIFDFLFREEPKVLPKYAQWVAKEFKPSFRDYRKEQIKKLLFNFEDGVNKNKIENKDINSYKLNDFLEAVELSNSTKSISEIKSESKKIYEDETYLVLEPLTVDASCYYGKSTKWCISAKQENEFKRYKSQGFSFVFLINKKQTKLDPDVKTAVAYTHNRESEHESLFRVEVYDSEDVLKYPTAVAKAYPKNIIEKINSYVGYKILPLSVEDDIQNIKNLTATQFEETLNNLGRFLYGDQAENVGPRQESGLKEYLNNLIEHSTIKQLAEPLQYTHYEEIRAKIFVKICNIPGVFEPSNDFYLIKNQFFNLAIKDPNLTELVDEAVAKFIGEKNFTDLAELENWIVDSGFTLLQFPKSRKQMIKSLLGTEEITPENITTLLTMEDIDIAKITVDGIISRQTTDRMRETFSLIPDSEIREIRKVINYSAKDPANPSEKIKQNLKTFIGKLVQEKLRDNFIPYNPPRIEQLRKFLKFLETNDIPVVSGQNKENYVLFPEIKL